MVYTQPAICAKECDAQTTWNTMDYIISARQPDKVKLKEREKKNKYLDLARGLKKKLSNMEGKSIPIVTGALCTVNEGL